MMDGMEDTISTIELTPEKVVLLSLIHIYCDDQINGRSPPGLETPFSSFLVTEIRNWHHPNLSSVCMKLSRIHPSGSMIAKRLCDKLDSFSAVNEIHDFFSELNTYVHGGDDGEDPVLQSESVFGLFVRRCVLAFYNSVFEKLVSLSDAILAYVQDLDVEHTSTSLMHGVGHDALEGARYAKEEAELIQTTSYNMFDVVQKRVRAAVQRAPHVRQVRFLPYILSLQQQDAHAANNDLHHYFDLLHSREDMKNDQHVKLREGMKVNRQAGLSLASMHLRLGHTEEAMNAVTEVIHSAQQMEDSECLSHALLILAQIVHMSSDPTARNLEARLLRRFVEWGCGNDERLAALGFLHLSRAVLTHNLGFGDAILCSQQALSSAEQIISRNGFEDLEGVFVLQKAASLLLKGHISQASATINVHLSRVKSHNPENECRMYCVLAVCESKSGNHSSAMKKLSLAKNLMGDSVVWKKAFSSIAHTRCLMKANLTLAERLSAQLCVLSTCELTTLPAHIESLGTHAQTLSCRGMLHSSCRLSGGLAALCTSSGNVIESLPHVMSAADCHLHAHSFVSVLPHILSCLSLSRVYSLTSIEASALVMLSEIMCSLGMFRQALHLSEQAIRVSAGQSVMEILARSHVAQAQALISCVETDDEDAILTQLLHVVDSLHIAQKIFCTLGWNEKEVHVSYILARVFNRLGDMEKRDLAASRFRHCINALHDSQPSHGFQILPFSHPGVDMLLGT